MAAKKTTKKATAPARKQNVPVPPDRELNRLTKRFESLSAKVAKNEFKSEMGGSRLADVRLRYQAPKLERLRIAKSNRLNNLLSGTKSPVNSLRNIMNSPSGGPTGRGTGQGGRGGGGLTNRGK